MISGTDSGTDSREHPRHRGAIADDGIADRGSRVMSQRNSNMLAALHAQIAERDQRIAELEARNTELEGYAYTISHDLKAPLVTIKGFISFLRRDVRTGDHKRVEHDLERISFAAGRMQRLLDDLLELARVGRVGNKPQQVPFAEVADEAFERVADRIKKGEAKVLIAPSLPEIYGDRSLLVDVLEQLLDNAVKHIGEQSTPCIEVGARDGASKGTETVLFVRDNGPGIHPRFQDKAFQLFERFDPEASDGTGVGLTLVKRIVEFHGGKIWIESSGRGSTMCFTLPGTRYQAESPNGS